MNEALGRFVGEVLETGGDVSEESHGVSDDVETSQDFVELVDDARFIVVDDFVGDSVRSVDAVGYRHPVEEDRSLLDVGEDHTYCRKEGVEQLVVEESKSVGIELGGKVDRKRTDVDVLDKGLPSFFGNLDVLPLLDFFINVVGFGLKLHYLSELLGYFGDEIEEVEGKLDY